jgi:hypothetical protein
VVRKYRARCAHTCQQCGTPGKRYNFDDRAAVLCVACAAPGLLLDDLLVIQNGIAAETTDAQVSLPQLPAGVRAVFADWVASREPETPTSPVPCWHLYEWLEHIEPLIETLRQVRNELTKA